MELGLDIGVDIGGTYIVAGLVRKGKILEMKQVHTKIVPDPTKEQVIAQLNAAVDPLMYRARQLGQRSVDVTYAVPAPLKGTKVIKCFNIRSLSGVDLSDEFPYPIDAQLDSTAFAMKKAMDYGSAADKVVGVIFGTGVSACAIQGVPRCIGYDGHQCTDEMYKDGTLDINEVHRLIGKPGIISRFQERTGLEATLEEIWSLPQTRFHAEIVDAAKGYLDHVAKTFGPQLIAVGGGHAQSLVPALRERYPQYPMGITRLSPRTSEDTILGAVALSEIRPAHAAPASHLYMGAR